MEEEKIKGEIEAILFASGRVVSLRELELSLELNQSKIIELIAKMQEDYKKASRGIEIVKVENGYTLSSKQEYHEYIYGVIDKRTKLSLSQAALEVLAIIAYNPKITRAEIENIRGVESNASLYRLLEHNLIEYAGKLDLPGRPVAYKVTENFLKKFGLNTLEDLPELPRYKMGENRQLIIDDILENQEETKLKNVEMKKTEENKEIEKNENQKDNEIIGEIENQEIKVYSENKEIENNKQEENLKQEEGKKSDRQD